MRRLLIVLLASALLATACGSSSDKTSGDPEGTLLVALLKLQNAPSTVTLTLHSDPQSLQALTAQGGGSLGAKADILLNSSITVSHTHASNPRDASSEITVRIGSDQSAIETRTVNRTLYVRVDAMGLLKTFGQSPAEIQRVVKEAKASGLDFAVPALQGKWLSLAGLDKLAAKSVPMQGDKQSQARNAFFQRLLSSAKVTRVGDDSAGEHLAIDVPARQAYAGIQDLISNLGAGLPPGASLPDPGSIPDKNIRLDAWVRDGKLTQLELDVRQFAAFGGQPLPAGVHTLAIRMTFKDFTGTITAPAGAVPVDLKALQKSFMGEKSVSSSSGASAPTAALIKCSQLKTLTASQLRAFAARLPKPQLKQLAHHCPSLHL
ncbi:MAG TPA: hypothetical protein VHV50_12515 [Actinomycetota bacterium]|nr:hypothetical protein [Actinomycetota bacterium]